MIYYLPPGLRSVGGNYRIVSLLKTFMSVVFDIWKQWFKIESYIYLECISKNGGGHVWKLFFLLNTMSTYSIVSIYESCLNTLAEVWRKRDVFSHEFVIRSLRPNHTTHWIVAKQHLCGIHPEISGIHRRNLILSLTERMFSRCFQIPNFSGAH